MDSVPFQCIVNVCMDIETLEEESNLNYGTQISLRNGTTLETLQGFQQHQYWT